MTNEARQAKLAIYGNAHAELTAALEEFPKEMWQFRAGPDGWTIHEIVIHITDSEANSFIRCRRAIAEPGSNVLGYDEMKWSKALNYHEQSTDAALALFKYLRGNTYELIKSLPESVWSHTIEHSESGVMTLDNWLDIYTRHVSDHVAQMRGVYEAWKQVQTA